MGDIHLKVITHEKVIYEKDVDALYERVSNLLREK